MQLVFEFGSRELWPIVEAIRSALGRIPYDIRCRSSSGTDYALTDDTLDSAKSKLAGTGISAVSVHPREGTIRYALILKPYFDGQSLSLHLGTIESTDSDYMAIWSVLLAAPGLTFACLGFEEGVEIADGQLTSETFPWAEWPVVVAALRDEKSGSWLMRKGPAAKSFPGETVT